MSIFGKRRRQTDVTGERDSLNYSKLGAQYYVAGRAAFFATCLPVAGNLLHHAVEMLIKGDLIQSLRRSELKRPQHNLKRLWKSYKSRHKEIDLSGLDPLIRELEKFERIRYPDSMTDKGMTLLFSVVAPNPLTSFSSSGGVETPRYGLSLNEIDALVKTICEVNSLNPQFHSIRLSKHGRDIFHKDNPSFPP